MADDATVRAELAADPGADDRADARLTRKFRQAAIVYLHVGLLYEFAAWEMSRAGVFPDARGPIGLWLAVGAVFAIGIPLVLWFWRNVWVPRVIWALHALRLPALIGGAFFPAADAALPTGFYTFAIVVVLVNLGFLARAGWDL